MERSLRISSGEMQQLYENLRQASESELATERDRLRTVIDTLSEGLCFLDPEARIVVMNRSGMSMLGVNHADDVEGPFSSPFVVQPGEGLDDVSIDLDEAVRTGTAVVRRRARCQGAANEGIPVSLTVVPVRRDSMITGAVAVFNDLRAEIQARRALEDSEDRYRNIFDLSPIASWEVDVSRMMPMFDEVAATGETDLVGHALASSEFLYTAILRSNIRMANPAAVELFGAASESELIGGISPQMLADDSPLPILQMLVRLWRGERQVSSEVTGRSFTGERRVVILNISAPEGPDGIDFTRLVFTFTDITERKADEERLAELMRLKDEFLATVSHELRTPLSGIVGGAAILEEGMADMSPPDRDELVGFIADESRELAALIEDLLVGARAEVGALSVVPEACDLDKEVNAVTAALSRSLARHSLDLGGLNMPVWADPIRLRQIIRNLITNAVRYGDDRVKVSAETSHGVTYLRVSDNGEGVDLADANMIFQPYQRTTAARGTPGSVGLGLTVSRQLARMMSGDLVYRREGHLSIFELSLPAFSRTATRH